VLNSNTFWICLSCETCATRCPNGIEIELVMDALREIAVKENRPNTTQLPLFHRSFLGTVKSYGKTYELGLIGGYTVKSGNIFRLKNLAKDAVLGAKMFSRGRLAVRPPAIKGIDQIKRIFEKTNK